MIIEEEIIQKIRLNENERNPENFVLEWFSAVLVMMYRAYMVIRIENIIF